jgi:hypothetical protein
MATAQQLQQLVSPIALYPDPLVAQILAASTYPTQIVDAERFVAQNPNLTGDALAAQVNPQPWDPSVKSLCQFPSVLGMMSQSLSWTEALGQAYFVQPQDVMAAIQEMRHRAMQAGTLKTTTQQRIVVEAAPASAPVVVQGGMQPPPQTIIIEPSQPNVVYVPAYNPSTVYGAAVPPPPGYSIPSGYSGTEMLVAGVVGFGAGMLVSSLINHGNNSWGTNWSNGNVVYNRNVFVSNSNYFINRYPGYRPPGYPPYPPAYPGTRPGYPAYANRPGYPPAYPNRPGYPPAYPNRPGYPPRPAQPALPNQPKLAATNPNLKPSMPKPGTYPNRPAVGNKSIGNQPGRNVGNRPRNPNTSNLAATKPYQPIGKPENRMMQGNGRGTAGNRSGPNPAIGSLRRGGAERAPGNHLKQRPGAPGARNLGVQPEPKAPMPASGDPDVLLVAVDIGESAPTRFTRSASYIIWSMRRRGMRPRRATSPAGNSTRQRS